MKYVFKKLPQSVIELEVVLDHEEFLNYYQPELDKALSNVHLKGFRPGTAPKEMAQQAIDKEKVFNEAANHAVHNYLQEICKEKDWQPISQPKADVIEAEPSKGIGLKFKVEMTVLPEVDLGNYQKATKKILKDMPKTIKVEEAELEKSIKWLIDSRAKIISVNREAKKGDVIEIEFSGFSSEGGSASGGENKTPLEAVKDKKDKFILGDGKFIWGFEDKIIGHKEGDTFAFTLDIDKDYWNLALRSKKVEFKVNLKAVFERQLPEFNDEFVKGLGKFENVAQFKNNISEGMEKENLEREKQKFRIKLLEAIVKEAKIELPDIMVEKTLENMVNEYKYYANKINFKDSQQKKTDDEIREEIKPKAQNNVATNLVLYQIAKEQSLEPSEAELQEESNNFLSHSQFSKNPNIDPQKLYDYIYGEVRNKKVFEYLESLK